MAPRGATFQEKVNSEKFSALVPVGPDRIVLGPILQGQHMHVVFLVVGHHLAIAAAGPIGRIMLPRTRLRLERNPEIAARIVDPGVVKHFRSAGLGSSEKDDDLILPIVGDAHAYSRRRDWPTRRQVAPLAGTRIEQPGDHGWSALFLGLVRHDTDE